MELTVQKRNVFGRKLNSLRSQNLIPAELYGRGINNVHLAVPVKDFKNVLKEVGESVVFDIVIDEKKRPVLIYNIHRHPVSDEILNIDFYQVKMDEAIKTEVPLEFIGEAPAVKEKNCVLVKVMQELEVEALPGDMPRSIEIDLTKIIEINDTITVEDLKPSFAKATAGKNVKILAEPDSVIATVKAQVTEEEEKAKEEEAVPSMETVKVEGEEQKEVEKTEEGKEE